MSFCLFTVGLRCYYIVVVVVDTSIYLVLTGWVGGLCVVPQVTYFF
jgi:hypothetical protein